MNLKEDQNNISIESSSLVLKISFLHLRFGLRLRIAEHKLQQTWSALQPGRDAQLAQEISNTGQELQPLQLHCSWVVPAQESSLGLCSATWPGYPCPQQQWRGTWVISPSNREVKLRNLRPVAVGILLTKADGCWLQTYSKYGHQENCPLLTALCT